MSIEQIDDGDGALDFFKSESEVEDQVPQPEMDPIPPAAAPSAGQTAAVVVNVVNNPETTQQASNGGAQASTDAAQASFS